MRANAQNSAQNAVSGTIPSEAEQRTVERARIASERARANAQFEQAERDCYQQFAVTDCLSQARAQRSAKLSDLQRQEVSLGDAERRERSAAKMREIEDRRSPERLQREAERRGRAMQEARERQQRSAAKVQAAQRKAQSTAVKPRDSGVAPPDSSAEAVSPLASKPDASAVQRPAASGTESQRAAQAAARQQEAARREQEIAERRAKVEAGLKAQQDKAKTSGKPVAPLPLPAQAP